MTPALERRAVVAGALAAAIVPPAAARPEAVRFGYEVLTDPREIQVARLYQRLPPAERTAWVRMGGRMADGMSARHAGYLMHRELGDAPAEARRRVDAAMAEVRRRDAA